MIVKVSGKIDGKEVIFERAEGDRWNATVPYDLDGNSVVSAHVSRGATQTRIIGFNGTLILTLIM